MAIKKNEVVRISLRGGLIGWFTVNPRRKIEKAVEYYNERGYNCIRLLNTRTRTRLSRLSGSLSCFALWAFTPLTMDIC